MSGFGGPSYGKTIVGPRINETLQIPIYRVPFRGSRYIGRCSTSRHRCGWNPDTSPIHRDRRDSVPRAGSDKSESSERDRPAPTGPDRLGSKSRGESVHLFFEFTINDLTSLCLTIHPFTTIILSAIRQHTPNHCEERPDERTVGIF